MLKREEIRIRDPFIYTDFENKCYYMYGTTDLVDSRIVARNTFSVYKTADLENFEEPKVIFDGSKCGFWADRDFWAPELHKYNEKYYLFGSCKAENKHRATHIFVCDTPDGEFVPLTEKPITPADWECLDGTFWVEDGKPYIVFSHEWTQIGDGEIWAMQLSEDLKEAVSEPFLLFHASDNPNVSALKRHIGAYVTDGPFLFASRNGELNMLWSSYSETGYAIGTAISETGTILGPWYQSSSPFFEKDGGHGMVFKTFEGQLKLAIHTPNISPYERTKLIDIVL
jgi:GH43 family beta-xylosidase